MSICVNCSRQIALHVAFQLHRAIECQRSRCGNFERAGDLQLVAVAHGIQHQAAGVLVVEDKIGHFDDGRRPSADRACPMS